MKIAIPRPGEPAETRTALLPSDVAKVTGLGPQVIVEAGLGAKPLRRVVGADTYTPLAGAAFAVIPADADIVNAAIELV